METFVLAIEKMFYEANSFKEIGMVAGGVKYNLLYSLKN
jgi:hypothetical protein